MSFEALAAELADRYRFERELGRGGMAVVFLAHDVKHSRPVAVKVLKPEFATTAFADRFFREIAIAARLSHPNILPLHDSGQAAGYLYYVTPYLEGESLRTWLRREHRLTVDSAVRLASEVADALDYAHRCGVIHRDIKPDNILISDGHAIVADFGIATALAADHGEHLTSTGLVLGSPGYMSPEQSLGGSVDARSDIYSLACVLFESLTGELAAATSLGGVPGSVGAKDVARKLQTTQPSMPRHIAAAIQRALAPLPANRQARAGDFKRAIVGESTLGRRQRPWWFAAAAGVAVVVALVAIIQLRPRPSAKPPQLEYAPLTNFADAATSPALSPDGRMLAFIRGSSTFYGAGQIYVKLLPDGEPLRLTNDSVNKMGPKFTPDGARITYTAFHGLGLDT